MPARTHVIAGRCTTTYDDGDVTEQRGDVLAVCKPDDTVLVHDANGYQPVAWLTRADRVAIQDDGLRAWKGDAFLEVAVEERYGGGQFPAGPAGLPLEDCPDCAEPLVRAGGRVQCLDCGASYGLPSDATLREATCEDCGLPRIELVRGQPFDVCLDPSCEPLDDAISAAYDRGWPCPECDEDLRVTRQGTLLLGCDAYPDCDWSTAFPRGEIVGDCECGLPVVESNGERSCLDDACEHATAPAGTPQ